MIGVSAGDGVNFITHPVSLSSSVLLLDNSANTYRIDSKFNIQSAAAQKMSISQVLPLLNVLLRVKFFHTSMILPTEPVTLREHLKYVLEVFTEVCVILTGIKKQPKHCVTANLEADMVNHIIIINP